MRPKVVLGIFLAAACILALGLILSKTSHPAPIAVTPPPAPAPAEPPAPAPVPVTASVPAPVTTPSAPAVATHSDTNDVAQAKEQHDEYVKKRYDELMAMAMMNDYASHQPIIQDLTNSDVAIRKAALEAVQQTQDRALIPEIQQIADATDDTAYKQALLDAIDYMKLPTLTEVMKQQKAQQNGAGNSSTQPAPPANPPQDQGQDQAQPPQQ